MDQELALKLGIPTREAAAILKWLAANSGLRVEIIDDGDACLAELVED
jgi:hypothetical protein